MKILLCTSEHGMGAGGLALHCEQLKEIFETLGHEVYTEVLLNPNDIFVLDGGYDSSLGQKLRTSFMLKRIVEQYSGIVDLCVSCGAGKTSYLSFLVCRNLEIPLHIVLCGSEVNLSCDRADLSFFNTEALSYATSVVGLSKELVNNAKALNRNDNCKYYVVPNIYELGSSEISKQHSSERIIYASGASFLGEKKGIANLIMAFSILVNELKRDDALLLYGRIDEDLREKYLDLISANKLENNVFLLGYMNRDEFHKKMEDVDVYIQASPFEGFGNSVAEALSIGKEILITNTGYFAERLMANYQDHIITSLDSKDMAETIYKFSTETIRKNENVAMCNLLREDLCKSSIVEKWNSILFGKCNSKKNNGNTTCLAVMFHDVDSLFTGIDYARSGFEKLMLKASMKGYRLCSANEYFNSSDKSNLVICTFDDGYENVYENALPIMKEFGFTATVYVCPDLIGKDNSWNHKDDINRKHMTHEMLKKVVDAGWEIGSHGISHYNLLRLSEHELDESLLRSKELLQEYGAINSFCYPYGAFNEFIMKKVKKYYDNAFSVSIGGTDYETNPYQIIRMTPEEMIKRLEL